MFDLYEFNDSDGNWYYLGCRPASSAVGACSQTTLDDASAGGFYDAERSRHAFVVFDGVDQFGREICLYYELDVATHTMRTQPIQSVGGVSVFLCGQQDPSVLDFHPVRGFRTASRNFVESGVGPSSAKIEAEPRPSRLTPSQPRTDIDARTLEQDANMQRRGAIVERLTERVMHGVR